MPTNYLSYAFDNEFQCMVYITEKAMDLLCISSFWSSRAVRMIIPGDGCCFKIGIKKPYQNYGKYEMLTNVKKELEKCDRLPIKKDINIYLEIADDLPFVVVLTGDETDADIAKSFRELSQADIPRLTKAQSFNPCYFVQAFTEDPLKKILEKGLAEIQKPTVEYSPDKDKRIEELEEELRRLRVDHDAREAERDAARAVLDEVNTERINLLAEIDALKEQINKLEEDNFDIGTSLEIAQGTAESLEDYIDELEKKLNPPKPKPNEPRYITIKGVKYRV